MRSSVIDSSAAVRASDLFASTAASAAAGSTYGWSKSPSSNLSVRILRTDSSMRCLETSPFCTSWIRPLFQPT